MIVLIGRKKTRKGFWKVSSEENFVGVRIFSEHFCVARNEVPTN